MQIETKDSKMSMSELLREHEGAQWRSAPGYWTCAQQDWEVPSTTPKIAWGERGLHESRMLKGAVIEEVYTTWSARDGYKAILMIRVKDWREEPLLIEKQYFLDFQEGREIAHDDLKIMGIEQGVDNRDDIVRAFAGLKGVPFSLGCLESMANTFYVILGPDKSDDAPQEEVNQSELTGYIQDSHWLAKAVMATCGPEMMAHYSPQLAHIIQLLISSLHLNYRVANDADEGWYMEGKDLFVSTHEENLLRSIKGVLVDVAEAWAVHENNLPVQKEDPNAFEEVDEEQFKYIIDIVLAMTNAHLRHVADFHNHIITTVDKGRRRPKQQ